MNAVTLNLNTREELLGAAKIRQGCALHRRSALASAQLGQVVGETARYFAARAELHGGLSIPAYLV
jgi:hypothetical protein